MNLNGMPKANLQDHDQVVPGNGYYPNLSTAYFIEHFDVDSVYASNEQVIVDKLTAAQAKVNQELESIQLTNGEHLNAQQTIFYKLAVYSLAKANTLVSRLGSSHRDNAAAQQQQAVDNHDYWQSESKNHIRLLQALSPNLTVALI